MLIDTYDKLMSGRRIRSLRFTGDEGYANFGGDGITIAHADDFVVAEAWICVDETGIWLAYNAHLTNRAGYQGHGGHEEPLASIVEIVYA